MGTHNVYYVKFSIRLGVFMTLAALTNIVPSPSQIPL